MNPLSPPPEDPAKVEWQTHRRYLYLLAKLLFFLVIGGLAYLVLRQIAGIFMVLFLSILTAYVLDPVVDWFEARKIPRTPAILILVTLLVVAGVGFALWMAPPLIEETGRLATRMRAWLAYEDPAAGVAQWLTSTFGIELPADLVEDVEGRLQEYAPTALAHIGGFLQGAAIRTVGLFGWLANALMFPIFVFYFLRDFDLMKAKVVEHLPVHRREAIVARARRVDGVVGEWLRGQVQVAMAMAGLYALGLGLTGIKLGVPIGILAGLGNVIPFLGFAFGCGLALIMVLLDWPGLPTLLAVAGVFTTVQLVESYVLTPRIVGEKVGLSPVTIIIVLLVGGELFGLLGFMLAVPVAGALKTILLEVVDWYRQSEHFLGRQRRVAATAPPAAEEEPPASAA